MKFKKLLSGAALLAAATLTLTGCGTGTSSSSGGAASSSLLKEDIKGKKISLMYWASTGEKKAMETLAKNFEEKTGAKVELQITTDDFQKSLTSRVAGKTLADVVYLDSSWAQGFASNFMKVDDLIDNKEDVYSQYLNAFKNDEGEVFAIPKDYSTLSMYINEDLLTKAGYKAADVPTTLEKLLPFAKELQSKLEPGVGAMTMNGDILARNMMYMETDGNKVVDAKTGKLNISNNAYATEYLNLLVQGHKDGYLKLPKQDLGQDWEGAAFTTNKAAIILEGNWVVSTIKEKAPSLKYVAKEMPTYKDKKATMAYTVGYGVNKDSKEKAAAAQFVNFATSGEGLKQYCGASGTLPTRKSVADSLGLTKDEVFKTSVAGAEYATVWSRGKYLGINATELKNQFEAVLINNADMKDSVKKAEDAAQQQIENLK